MFIKIEYDDTMNEIDEDITNENIIDIFTMNCKNKNNNISLITNIDDLYFYSHKKGTTKNNHIIPRYNNNIYDELFVIKKNNNEIHNLDICEYAMLYYEYMDDGQDDEQDDEQGDDNIENNDIDDNLLNEEYNTEDLDMDNSIY
jgi:hypothetical protein